MASGDNSALVWYACYGSNLSRDRFLRYIHGGKPEHATVAMRGCRDTRDPVMDRPVEISHRLYFASASSGWGGGGVAFIESREADDADAATLGRMYLIRRGQFAEVFAQENGLAEMPEIDFKRLDKRGRLAVVDGQYGYALRLGERDGHPIYTFTSRARVTPDNAPHETYLRTILAGLIEAYPATDLDHLSEYLSKATGGAVGEAAIGELAARVTSAMVERWHETVHGDRGTRIRLRVLPTIDRVDTQREFIVQVHPSICRRLGVADGGQLRLSAAHGAEPRVYSITAPTNEPTRDTMPQPHEVRMDQKLRVAIGLRVGDWVWVEREAERRGDRMEGFLEYLIKTQPQLMRVQKANFEDMEIDICRMPATSFDLIGVEPGGYVRVHSVERSVRVRAMLLSPEAMKRRADQMRTSTVYEDPHEALELYRVAGTATKQDLPPIFIDFDLRQKLGIKPFDAVRVVRDVSDVCVSRLYMVMIPVVLTMIGAAMSLEIGDGWKALVLALGALIAVATVFVQARARVG